MELLFYKFSATGNDFILFDNRDGRFTGEELDFFRRICQRRTAVGADGVLLIETHPKYDFRMRYINSDGSETACGNGSRSAAFFAYHKGIAGAHMTFIVGEEVYDAAVEGNVVKLKMPQPRDQRRDLQILEEKEWEEAGYVNTGVPHYVLFGKNIANANVLGLGKKYRYHAHFQPQGANVNFVEVLSSDRIKIRTYERGVENETLSCGTGCVAAAYFANLCKSTSFPTEIETQGGQLRVSKDLESQRLLLEGEVSLIYEGKLISENVRFDIIA